VIDGLHVNNLLSFAAHSTSVNHDLHLSILNERLYLLRKAQVPLFVQDARDYHALSRILTDLNPQVIVHLAAVAHAVAPTRTLQHI